MGRTVLFLSAVVLAMTACTFDYGDGTVEADDSHELPQVEILDVRMVIVRDNRVELNASRIASYQEEGIQEFNDILFREYGPDGDLRLEGSADSGILYLDTEDVELLGTVQLFSRVEDGRIESDFLYWENATRVLRGDEVGPVHLRRDDGTEIEGRGLYLDGRRNTLEFRSGVRGTYRSENDG
ncbi:MAG: LPS export ABC transporter periplasmic protein LptC [Spirochaeta sp.]|jgi:LPS export ABC transporter protein LptC|nr:LPS export ABC transporter periplasmic protein LptC [Spirochaeta sp.]